MAQEKLDRLLAEAGPLDDGILEIIDIVGRPTEWAVRFNALDVLVTHLPDVGLIGFSTVIDGPDDSISGPVFRALLAANALWPKNGGLRFALGSAANSIEVSILQPDHDITAADIARLCRTVAETAASWSLLLSGAVPPPPDPTESTIPDPFNPDLIRL